MSDAHVEIKKKKIYYYERKHLLNDAELIVLKI